MSKLRDAAQQALEALKKSHPYSNSDRDLDKHSEAIHALRSALYGSKLGDGWFQWNGGDCPVPAGTLVQVRFRRGGDEISRIAEVLEWEHRNLGWWWDIVAYRIVRAAAEIGRNMKMKQIEQPAALAEQQAPVEATPYNLKRIAWELERTALGDGFYGNALRVAKDIPGIRLEDRSVLDRYATGTQTGTDHVHLQWLVQALYNTYEQQPLTREEIFEIAEPFGEFKYGDAQGHKRIDFANAIIAAYERKNGVQT